MADRKVYATVEGTIMVPVRVKREVIVRVDESTDANTACEECAEGKHIGKGWNIVDCGSVELMDCENAIQESIDDLKDSDRKFAVDNVLITDSK